MGWFDRARAQAATSADLHHDDGLRLGRHGGRSDEARRLRLRHEAAQSRQGGDADRPRAGHARIEQENRTLAAAGRRALRPREHHRRVACLARSARYDPAGSTVFGKRADRWRERHREGARGACDSQPEPAAQGEVHHGALRALSPTSSRASSSVTSAAHLPARTSVGSAASSRRTAARSSWTRSGRSTRARR
jgi:hypothetical protein